MKFKKYGTSIIVAWGLITIIQMINYGLGATFPVFMAFLTIWIYQIQV